MFALSFVALVLASTAAAGPLKRYNGLSVSLAGPNDISSLDELKFTASVTNNGAEDVKVLKYGTILDSGLPTRSFTVTKDGAEVAFTGVKLSVSLEDADETAFAVIPAGETVTVTHEVASVFDFAKAGAGSFTFEPVQTFQIAGADAEVKSIVQMDKVSASSAPSVTVNIVGDLTKREMAINKRATDICTTASRKSFIDASYSEAKSLASIASSYIGSNGANSLFTSYYKTNSPTTIRSVFNAVAGENSSSRTLSCVDSLGACSSGVIAYTSTQTTNIYYCSIFFNEVATSSLCSGTSVASRNVRGGTTLHELTHAVAGTDDVGYGCSFDQGLSAANARVNADNYNCFSTQVYANTQC
ncbi:zincin [Dendrothele bispora CBS 962.96]|uniref:Neutral protease 2 n=1 Tax=Dendrothele bispora (strain CBS 962.96) TaxID=1314807 RepID=A0A4S8LP41_DENBC|nr:zincin [Dendrothele bispora CBS 962.96]